MFDKVFISYAKEDYSFAIKINNFLSDNGFIPWLDKNNILPGQDWNFIIRKALREANYIILLLSNIAIKKRGYIQREFKIALDFVQEKLEDDIYIIPLKFDACFIPDNLQRFQWIEYSDERSFRLILSSLNHQREKYLEDEKRSLANLEVSSYEEIEENFEYGKSKKYLIQSKYFQFTDESNKNLKELNRIIGGKQASFVANCRKEILDLSDTINVSDEGPINWSYDVGYSLNMISRGVISINETSYEYTGGVHGNGFVAGLNYHLNPVFKINLQDLFDFEDHEPVLSFISKYCFEELRRIYNGEMELTSEEFEQQTPQSLFWPGSLDPKWENFDTFFISKNGIEIIFNQYSVSSYSFGIQIIQIPYDNILPILTECKLLESLVRKIK